MLSGYRPPARLPKFVLVLFHPHPRPVERDAFSLQPQTLFQAVFARKRDFAFGSYHAMPRQPSRRASQRPHHLTSATGKARRARHIAVGGNFALGNLANCVANDVQHWLLSAKPGPKPG